VLWTVAALLFCASPAPAAPVRVTGSIVVRWHSNPAACEAEGLCGRSGVLSWRPVSEVSQLDLGDFEFAFFNFYEATGVARSYRVAGDSVGTCIDRDAAPPSVVLQGIRRKGGVVFSMREFNEFSFGHCAGPLGSDFAQALPESSPVSNASLRPGSLIDFGGRTPFSAGPFEGEVVSTLALRAMREPRNEATRSRTRSRRRSAVAGSSATAW
jgi:hypothetical protein